MSIQIPYSVDHSMISQSENTFPSPISGACVECRSRHLKCDSGTPVCGRCQYEERQCQYVQSRRGHKGPRKRRISSTIDPIPQDLLTWEKNTREINNISFEQMTNTMAYNIADVSSRSLAIAKSQGPQTSKLSSPFDSVPDQESFSTPYEELFLPLSCVIPNEQPSKEQGVFDKPSSNHRTFIRDVEITERTKSLELYYLHFHCSHPILLPRNIFFGASFEQFPSCLKKVMQFIGSHYLSKTLADRQLVPVSEEVSAEKSRSGYMVQALLLYAIVLHARDDQSQAEKMINAAFEMAINLGMHREEFATDHGCGSRYLEESWRKTWWELYVVGSMISLHMQIPFKRSTIDMSALLPNDEITDLDAVSIRKPQTLSRFRERAFAEDEVVYSSFAYRVEAARLVSTILKLGDSPFESSLNEVEAIDISLTSWILHLPPSKREVLDHEGKVDEMLFQAHMIISAGLIYLHRPRSNLVFTSIQEKTQCTRPEQYLNPVTALHVHAAKAIRGANNLSNLISLPISLTDHTPFFTCTITLAAIIHLAAYSVIAYADGGNAVRERIQMEVGALKSISGIWPIAGNILQQVKAIAREIFILDPQNSNRSEPTTSHSQDEMDNFVNDEVWLHEMIDTIPDPQSETEV